MPMLLDDLQTVVWPKLVRGHQLTHQCVDGGRIGDVFRTHHQVASRTGWRGDRQPAELDDLLRQRQSFEYADTAADGCRAEVRCGNHVYGTRKVGASQPYPSGGHRTHHSAKRGDLRDDFRATIQCARMLDPVAGGIGAVIMNGVKRGLFSNEAGSGSAPCAAAAAQSKDPVRTGLTQSLGVLIDTIVICSCTAFLMLLAPDEITGSLAGMDLLQAAMGYHLGKFGVIFIAVILWLFSFSTFLGILYYARSNVSYLFGDSWAAQTAYKVLALVMLFIGGVAAYTIVWDLGDVGVGLMTIFNLIALYPMAGEALASLKDYEEKRAKGVL